MSCFHFCPCFPSEGAPILNKEMKGPEPVTLLTNKRGSMMSRVGVKQEIKPVGLAEKTGPKEVLVPPKPPVAFEIEIKKTIPPGTAPTPAAERLHRYSLGGSSVDWQARTARTCTPMMRELAEKVRVRNTERQLVALRSRQQREQTREARRAVFKKDMEEAIARRSDYLTNISTKAAEHSKRVISQGLSAMCRRVKGIEAKRRKLRESMIQKEGTYCKNVTTQVNMAKAHNEHVTAVVSRHNDEVKRQLEAHRQKLQEKASRTTALPFRSRKAARHNRFVADKVQEHSKQSRDRTEKIRAKVLADTPATVLPRVFKAAEHNRNVTTKGMAALHRSWAQIERLRTKVSVKSGRGCGATAWKHGEKAGRHNEEVAKKVLATLQQAAIRSAKLREKLLASNNIQTPMENTRARSHNLDVAAKHDKHAEQVKKQAETLLVKIHAQNQTTRQAQWNLKQRGVAAGHHNTLVTARVEKARLQAQLRMEALADKLRRKAMRMTHDDSPSFEKGKAQVSTSISKASTTA